MHQIFMNILSNAIQSIVHDGQISIVKRYSKELGTIVVIDNGEGISQENLGKIYDPFFTTKSPGNGTGLGLSIVSTMIKEHNGTIDCLSAINEGTSFKLSFPKDKKRSWIN